MGTPNNPLKQNESFYCGPWTRSVETIVLSKLEEAMSCGEFVKGDPTTYHKCAKWVRNVMIEEHGLVIPVEVYTKKFIEWEERYGNFLYLKGFPLVFYDPNRNSIWAHRSTWARLLKISPELAVYESEGELNWTSLEALFGKDDNNNSGPSESVDRGGVKASD